MRCQCASMKYPDAENKTGDLSWYIAPLELSTDYIGDNYVAQRAIWTPVLQLYYKEFIYAECKDIMKR